MASVTQDYKDNRGNSGGEVSQFKFAFQSSTGPSLTINFFRVGVARLQDFRSINALNGGGSGMMYLGDELTGRHVQVPGLQAPRDITPTPRTAPWKHGSMTAASNNDRHLSGGGMVRNREIARGGAWEGRSVSGQLVSGCTVWSKKFDDGSLNTKQNTLRHVSWPSTSKVAWRHAVGENCTRRNIGAYEDAPAPRLASRPSFPFSGRHVKPAPPWRVCETHRSGKVGRWARWAARKTGVPTLLAFTSNIFALMMCLDFHLRLVFKLCLGLSRPNHWN
ncbi:hypothetical protein B0H65DRAFT_540959 [Neurospora tetraspora]|uniref:Uncharacterized protein n=1 Tax=Neurospora tetraspora TaxID=94610 RepID=A0AAE0JA98_9PEZI|nr:hypothetical protein B0H65DRAFT_540959 [Neurospora tetraspora]